VAIVGYVRFGDHSFTALVVGGSVGGLAVAHELRSIGADVVVYERSVDRTQPRGAGIVMQPEVEALLSRLGRSVSSVSVLLKERQHLHGDGRFTRYGAPQWMSAWDTLFSALRDPLADVCYLLDSALTRVDLESGCVTATFGSGHVARGDLLVGADGIGSTTRAMLGIPGEVSYAGYVAFRGLEAEADLPSDLVELLSERFTFFGSPGMQMLCYLVPGPNGELDPGRRRVNWVWYLNTPAKGMQGLMIGDSGRRFEHFLPPGELTVENTAAVTALAEATLPAQFAGLVEHSKVFLQPVFDLEPSRMFADHVVLVGDAAGTVRPHTASGTSKAFGDAAQLAHALDGWSPPDALPVRRLKHWEKQRLIHLEEVARSGVRLAAQSLLGTGGPEFRLAGTRDAVSFADTDDPDERRY
jgi:2-polyprenyl-6-methoxyphenol hydroxylase-like FAD-dependent oxidoreductase